MNATGKPSATEHAPYYARYVARCPEADLMSALLGSIAEQLALLKDLPESAGDHRYAPEKWTIKDVLQHMLDTERVFAYRALRFARNDSTGLPGFDEDHYARNVETSATTIAQLLEEAEVLRRSTLLLFERFEDAQLMRSGTANGQPCTTRAAGWIIAGHTLHHLAVLKERYLVGL